VAIHTQVELRQFFWSAVMDGDRAWTLGNKFVAQPINPQRLRVQGESVALRGDRREEIVVSLSWHCRDEAQPQQNQAICPHTLPPQPVPDMIPQWLRA
jgi:hypothetical protein